MEIKKKDTKNNCIDADDESTIYASSLTKQNQAPFKDTKNTHTHTYNKEFMNYIFKMSIEKYFHKYLHNIFTTKDDENNIN